MLKFKEAGPKAEAVTVSQKRKGVTLASCPISPE
jgi:hypothetical protein